MKPNPSRLKRLFATISHAVAVSGAVEAGRKARNEDLIGLGIDPDSFNSIRR